MVELMEKLEKMGFTKIESMIYLTLLNHGELTGYQIAKILGVTRSSVYPVLDSLYRKGVIFLIPGETNIYSGCDPIELIEKMKNEFNSSADFLKDKLQDFRKDKSEERYVNISGFDNIIAKAKEIILSAEREVYMNTHLSLDYFKDEIKKASKKGVRIIVFSWTNLDTQSLPVELYSNYQGSSYGGNDNSDGGEKRLMVVADMKKCLIASNMKDEYLCHSTAFKPYASEKSDFHGQFTDNKFLAAIITEHIHFDIYLYRLKQKHGYNLVEKDIQIDTMMEKGG